MSKNKSDPLLDLARETTLEGMVERVVFHNDENGYTVLRIQVESENGKPVKMTDTVACVGHMLLPRPGCRLRFEGRYVINARYGKQLVFQSADELMPVKGDDIRAYLSSGLIKGVGKSLADRIVDKFGDDTIRILDEEPMRLSAVKGVGEKNIEQIRKSWDEHRGMRDLQIFLQPHGISTSMAIRIYKAYGSQAKMMVRENPYRLAMDVRGIGFLTADDIAAKLGFAPDNPLRIQAGALYILQKASEDGHVYLPEDELMEKMCQQLDCPPEQAANAIEMLDMQNRLVREILVPASQDRAALTGIYLSRFHHCESKTAFYLQRLMNTPKSIKFENLEKLLQSARENMPFALAPEQIEAARASAKAKTLVITGGPGTGKTTIIKAIIKLFQAANAKILLAAPTGRAAKRMSEACGLEAKTIHRLLEYSPRDDKFVRDEDNPLTCGLLVVDEASMMDTLLFYYLLKAVPLGATLVLVGDVHQLPSVGPGNVLGDIIDSSVAPVVRLNEIFRQSAQSEIICNAHLINHGQMPDLEKNTDKISDFYFIARDDPSEAADLIVDLIKNHIPRRFGLDSINEIQLLAPMHKGAVGAENMNSRLQEALNPNALEVRKGDRAFRLHDKVMQVRNNYDKDIFNGDIGFISYINPKERNLSVNFDGEVKSYEFDELDELVPAYAISIHKSQGSEYPAVVIPLMMQHYIMLQRNLVYTGVTRGKKLVILVGESRALQMAIRNNKTSRRYTWLAQRLARGIRGYA